MKKTKFGVINVNEKQKNGSIKRMSYNKENLNDMTIQEAALFYSLIGIVTHPLNGKEAKLKDWPRLIETPFGKIKLDGNLGFICGQVSDLTVVDVDWYVKGIWDNILQGIDESDWIKQAHTDNKWHWLFRYCKALKAGRYQAIGIDILSDSVKLNRSTNNNDISGNNCVAAPSVHADGNKYQIVGSIENRPDVPEPVVKRINYLLSVYGDLTKTVIPKCRDAFKKLWSAVFIERKNKLYHDFSIFAERNRLIHFNAELKANGASDVQIHLVCMLIFGNAYDARKSDEEIKQIDPRKTATNESIIADPILKPFHKVKAEPKNASRNEAIDEVEEVEIDSDDIDYDELGISPDLISKAEKMADKILANGNPIKYIMKTVAKRHTGDVDTEEALCISIAGQSCLNTDGMQISVSGPSGSGKSHGLKTHLILVPARFKREGSLSGKAAYYHDLKPGMIIFSDDTEPDADMTGIIKEATTNYKGYTVRRTVKDQNKLKLSIPPRINWYLTCVDPQVSEQLLNRQITFETSSDYDQKLAIFNKQGDEAETGEMMQDVDLRVLVCRRIYAKIKELEPVKVLIPFGKKIRLADISNSRNFPLLLDMIRGYTIFNYQQRERNENGDLIATKEDFENARRLFESRAENIITHLTKNEKAIVEFIMKHPGCTVNDIADGVKLSDGKNLSPKTIYALISGRSDRKDTGLIYKVKGMQKDTTSNPATYKITGDAGWNYAGKEFVTLNTDSNIMPMTAECA
jgi:hypothetical protein